MKRLLSWLVALLVLAIRLTCRVRFHRDPRADLDSEKTAYVYASLHAHVVAAVMAGESGTGAMVSRSEDGQFMVPALKLLGLVPIRGSSGRGSGKGGATALHSLVKHVESGQRAFLAIDGPKGPRGHVHRGISMLARKSNAVVLAVVGIPERRWILSKTWDRLQIPQPFTKINVHFAPPLAILPQEDLETFAGRIEAALAALEQEYDPAEACQCRSASVANPSSANNEASARAAA